MPGEKNPRTEAVRKALADRPTLAARDKARQPLPPAKPAVKKPKKENPRSAVARDARAKQRGRLPVNTVWTTGWDGKVVKGTLAVHTVPPGVDGYKGGDIVNDQEWVEATVPKVVRRFENQGDGVFRVMEELDIMFWNWFAAPGDEGLKALLVFEPNPPAPAPM